MQGYSHDMTRGGGGVTQLNIWYPCYSKMEGLNIFNEFIQPNSLKIAKIKPCNSEPCNSTSPPPQKKRRRKKKSNEKIQTSLLPSSREDVGTKL